MADAFGWNFTAARAAGRLVISYVPMGSLDLDILATSIRADLADRPVGRVAIDSLAELAFAARESDRFPAYKRSLIGLIRASSGSVLVTSESPTHGTSPHPPDFLTFLFDNVIELRYIEEGSQIGRAINIAKMRTSRHNMDVFRCSIGERGITTGDRIQDVTGILGWTVLRTHDQRSTTITHAETTNAF
jgi:circadian clock protein KaiC